MQIKAALPQASKWLTVLFTWEIGHGLGHVMPMLPIARALQAQGHRVIFALRDVRVAGTLLQGMGFTVLQAPAHPDRFFPAKEPQPQTMADILTIFGFASKQHLSGLLAAWRGLIGLCQPDVVVASYAPLSLLCARQIGIPTVLMALPFELPVNQHPSPLLRSGVSPHSAEVDERVIANVNAVLGASCVSSVYDIFKANATYLMSFVELDTFGPREGMQYCGSLVVTDTGIEAQWPQGTGAKVLVYLQGNFPNLEALRQALQASSLRYCVVIGNAQTEVLDKWQAPNVWATSAVVRFDHALASCDAVLSSGGNGFISASLLASKPIVCHTQNLEPYLTARQVVKIGAGILPRPATAETILQSLHKVLAHPHYAEAAAQFAHKHQGHVPKHKAQEIAHKILELAVSSRVL
jgi:UDP:flavonoid glycosyltransferase YjiC (YdhE family)